ncbi:MAG: hydroxymethylglutaryl-CoA lyase [Proteobacteria bacterium]|nr:MAG: hydroxymethylglutaryl-CoA lyase [Pseudomonadota bacterium]
MTSPANVRIVEVGPRDGLQNESREFSTQTRIELVRRLLESGCAKVEAGSFVSPKWVPKMADTAQVLEAFDAAQMDRLAVLVPNDRGMESAVDAGVREIAIFGAASETFSRKNINCSIADSLARFEPVCELARRHEIRIRGYISCVLGCPYEGEVDGAVVARIAARLFDMGCYEVSLGDTIGVGTPLKARALVETVAADNPIERLAVHFHDTYGQAVANIFAALELGIGVVDCSVAGLGGCPYAPGAAGNVATEDVLYLLDGMGIAHGIDVDRLLDAARFILDALGKPPVSRVSAARLGRCDT